MPIGVIPEEFCSIADEAFAAAIARAPSDAIGRFTLFVETVRVLDYWFVAPDNTRLAAPDFQILEWGWNLATAHLFSPLQHQGGFPLSQSTPDTRAFATGFLHQLGSVILMRRAAEMIRLGFLNAERTDKGFTVRTADKSSSTQFLDIIEFSRLESLEREIWGSARKNQFHRWIRDDIDSLMMPLVHPWNTGRGVMMGYGALPEIDDHFLAEAMDRVSVWCSEAGIHPDTNLGNLTGADLVSIGGLIIALHAKHVRFAMLACQRHPEISIPQSLTIWGRKSELVDSIVDYIAFERTLAERAIDAVSLRPTDMSKLRSHTTPFRPLLIDLGNGLILRPVSSLTKNPFHTIRTLQEWRDPHAKNRLSAPREEWMRSDIYALFQGNRYTCVEGNIKVRQGARTITDIDGAIFDRVTGELALFQIKWQDFSTNSITELRSKARNFSQEMDDWAEKVSEWADHLNTDSLAQILRLKLRKQDSISAIYLFGVSRTAARFKGYGFTSQHPRLALSTWPQFIRVRYQVRPIDHVFLNVHKVLRAEMDAAVTSKPMAVSISICDKSINFEDLWSAVDDEKSGSDGAQGTAFERR